MARREAWTPAGKIAGLRKIVEHKQHAVVCGSQVDLFTASAIVAVYDGLNPENQAKLAAMSIRGMASIAFALIKK